MDRELIDITYRTNPNLARAEWARKAVKTFMETVGDTELRYGLRDLLTNLMHLYDLEDLDFRSEFEVAF